MVEYVEVVSIGTLVASLVHPREVFRMAIMHGVSSIIIGHNHPSGVIAPSDQDRKVALNLCDARKALGIGLLDYVIIGINGSRFSFAESAQDDLRDS